MEWWDGVACTKGGGSLGNRISCLNPPRAKFKKGGRVGGGCFALCGVSSTGRAPRPPQIPPHNPTPNEIHSVRALRTVGYAAQV